jgi:hypothetical protein
MQCDLPREKELVAEVEKQKKAASEARAARLEAAQAQAALGEVLAARRGAREALRDMAAQNARLVVAYCAKKAELKRLQDGLAAERAQWEVRITSALCIMTRSYYFDQCFKSGHKAHRSCYSHLLFKSRRILFALV